MRRGLALLSSVRGRTLVGHPALTEPKTSGPSLSNFKSHGDYLIAPTPRAVGTKVPCFGASVSWAELAAKLLGEGRTPLRTAGPMLDMTRSSRSSYVDPSLSSAAGP